MTLKSAYEDLRQRTVERIPGILGKLRYVAGLRSSTGDYAHWGLERVHGSAAAQDAFAQVHKSLVKTVLRTRLSSLCADLEQSSQADGVSPVSYVSKLRANPDQLLPERCPREAELHLLSVLETLSALEDRQNEPSQPS